MTLKIRTSMLCTLVAATAIGAGGSPVRSRNQKGQMIDPNRVVAVVNGEEIKGAEYYRRMEYLSGVGYQAGRTFLERSPRILTLQKLISERLKFSLAKSKGVYPSDDDVEAELNIRKEDNPKVLENWAAVGGDIDELKYQLRLQLCEFNLKTLGISKTDKEIEDFYNDHPLLYTIPKSLKLRLIAVAASDDTKIVDQDLASGKDFATEAQEKSIDVSKTSGGLLGVVSEDNLTPETQEALKNTKVGKTTNWLTTAADGGKGNYLKFLLEEVIPPKKQDFDAKLKRTIRRKLMVEMGQIKNGNLSKDLEAERTKIKVEIKPYASSSPNSGVDPERTILSLNGEDIKGAEYFRRMEYLEGVGIRVSNSFSELPPGFITIRQLINERVAANLAKDEGIYPNAEEVNAELEIRKHDDPKLIDEWTSAGGTLDELRSLFTVELVRFKILSFGITITDTEVENYYNLHPDLYTRPKQLKLRVIEVPSTVDKNLVDQELSSARAFADVAKERSIDPSKVISGDYGTVPEFRLIPAFRTALEGAKIGGTSKWAVIDNPQPGDVQGSHNFLYYKFLLEDIIPAKKLDLDSALRQAIRKVLMVERGIAKNGSLEKLVDQRLAKTKIEIRQPEFADAYQKYLSAHLKLQGIN